MPAHFIPIGEPAHDAERQGLRFLVDGLPQNYTVFGNPWIVERSGVVYELDAVVVAPHALYVVEIKSYRGRIEGTDHDWHVPYPIASPLKKNRLTAQALRSQLKRENYQAGQVWVQGFVFLSTTTDVGVRGPASADRVYTRKNILAAVQDEALAKRLSSRHSLVPTAAAENDLLRILTGVKRNGPRPIRQVREYEVVETLSHDDSFTELLGRNKLSDDKRVLRIYSIPPLATDSQREHIEQRARWEAQVLGRLGRSRGILSADPPFSDESGIVLPLEYFPGITLPTWLDKYGPASKAKDKDKADLIQRTDLWMRIARTLDEAHSEGVVHRLLRPEVILVEDAVAPAAIRVTGFDLAKQLSLDTTIVFTSLADERLALSAPEVVSAFSSAEPASDQFSLGAILALLLTGRSLFENTRRLMEQGRVLMRVRDMAQRLPLSLDEAVSRMVELRATDRFPTLTEAIDAVRLAREPGTRPLPGFPTASQTPLDADNLQTGMRIGTDYEIISRLGQGGMAVVYAARHLVSGATRALKIARLDDAAEDALRNEYQALKTLDHPNIVRVIDITKVVDGRLTLVMERGGGQTLRHWLAADTTPHPQVRRRLAEDLLAGLDYLEHQGITHKDFKPDNLLVGDERLTIIDFSLAGTPEDAVYGGTALYRDPASARWSHATDRYAAALCIFELYAGRHAFDGRVPEPDQPPSVSPEDIDPPGLAAFFHKALNPVPDARFPSARAMRDALLVALGEDIDPVDSPESQASAASVDASTPIALSGLSQRAINALERNQIRTVGELLALAPHQVEDINSIGTKTAADILAFQQALHARGLTPDHTTRHQPEPPLVPGLCDCAEPVTRLPLPQATLDALIAANLPTVGAVARLSRRALLAIPTIGQHRLAGVVEALHQLDATTQSQSAPHTLDRIWNLAAASLTDRQRVIVECAVGLLGDPQIQSDIAADLALTQPTVSNELNAALERIDRAPLAAPFTALDTLLDGFHGILRVDDLGRRFEEAWPAGLLTGEGILRLLLRLQTDRAHLIEVDGADFPLVATSAFDRPTLRAFTAEVTRLATHWPPLDADTARRALAVLLPHYPGDPLALGQRISSDVQLTDGGQLFIGPIDATQSIPFVLDQTRDAIPLSALADRVRATFGHATPYPAPDELLALLHSLDCRLQGDLVIPGRRGSITAPAPLAPDLIQTGLGQERPPEIVIRDMLSHAATTRGFRMLITPPEHHARLGRSVAAALPDAHWHSFEDAFFTQHGPDLATLERAERFIAQRDTLTEAAELTLTTLLADHGHPGTLNVLGDTALLGLCDALDLPRRLYDDTLSGRHGSWILVVPGVIHKRQPRFNEGPAMWHLEGATLALTQPLPPLAPATPPTEPR